MTKLAWIATTIGVAGLIAAGYLLRNAQPEFQGAVLVFAGSVGAAICTHWMAKRREIEARHFEQKRAAYETLSGLWFKLIAGQKQGGTPVQERELIASMLTFKEKLLAWGDIEMIRAWTEFEDLAQGGTPNTREMLLVWDRIWGLIRKELGHADSARKELELASIFLTAEARKELSE